MTSASPPYPWFSGITYNPSFFTSSATGDLTKAQANALYLRKTVPDTATALETFNGGIQTNNVDSIGNDLYLNSSNTLNIGTLTNPVLNMVTQNSSTSVVNIKTGTYTTGDVNICTGNGRAGILHLGDGNNLLAGSGTHINNGTFNASNTNIANGANTSGSVNILSGVSSTGTINLGQITGTATINVNRPLTCVYNPSAITGTNQLGYKIAGAATGVTVLTPANTSLSLWSATLTSGIWLITGVLRFLTPGLGATQYITGSISSTNNAGDIAAMVSVSNTSNNNQVMQVTRIVNTNVSGVGPWYLVGQCSAITNVDSIVFNVYRIA
jgi:hypothetical protein